MELKVKYIDYTENEKGELIKGKGVIIIDEYLEVNVYFNKNDKDILKIHLPKIQIIENKKVKGKKKIFISDYNKIRENFKNKILELIQERYKKQINGELTKDFTDEEFEQYKSELIAKGIEKANNLNIKVESIKDSIYKANISIEVDKGLWVTDIKLVKDKDTYILTNINSKGIHGKIRLCKFTSKKVKEVILNKALEKYFELEELKN